MGGVWGMVNKVHYGQYKNGGKDNEHAREGLRAFSCLAALYYLRSKFLMRLQRILVLIGSFLISGCCDCDIPDCTASNYKETLHCTCTSVVLGIAFFFSEVRSRKL